MLNYMGCPYYYNIMQVRVIELHTSSKLDVVNLSWVSRIQTFKAYKEHSFNLHKDNFLSCSDRKDKIDSHDNFFLFSV